MTATTIDIDASPEAVHATLVDATSYPEWLVGARHIRGVDESWPAPDAAFHHTIGWGPVKVRDHTSVVRNQPPAELVLNAGLGPLGSARVRFTVSRNPDGGSHVAFEEEPVGGVVRALWNPVTRPLVGLSIWGRNAISLQSLRALAEERTADT